MRELEFRAWDTTLNKMLHSLTLKQIMKGDFSNTKIDQLIIEQYTNVKGKDGKKIFEGDIIKGQWGSPVIVGFNTEDCWSCSCCNEAFSGAGFMAIGEDLSGSEIIGNIHENPELLNLPT